MTATVAIVGRPNVGKSALFNRIAGRRIAIVHDQPGVTRDRISAEVEWRGRPFTLIDTGGIGLLPGEKGGDPITRAALTQVEVALEAADVLILVVNAREGVVALDREVAARLHQAGRPVLLAVNKVDNPEFDDAVPEFAELGFETLLPVSAIHGRGIEPLMKSLRNVLPSAQAAPASAEPGEETGEEGEAGPTDTGNLGPLKLVVVGRPNVGKSSLVNALTDSSRVVVSPVPGTTRDAVDVPLEIATDGRLERYLLIDTAGMRKARRVKDSIEFYSVKRAEKSIERADLVVFVLDAESGILEQDKKIADKIVAAQKACVVVVNKWDLYAEQVKAARREQTRKGPRQRDDSEPLPTSMADFVAWVKQRLFFLDYAPVVFTSATEGTHLGRLLEAVRFVADQLRQRVPTALLNRTLQQAIEERQPVSATGARLRFFYATQIGQAPPRFLLFVNQPAPFAPQYEKFLVGRLRQAFGFEGCPIVLHARARPKKVDFRKTETGKGRSQKRPGSRPKQRSKTKAGKRPARSARKQARR